MVRHSRNGTRLSAVGLAKTLLGLRQRGYLAQQAEHYLQRHRESTNDKHYVAEVYVAEDDIQCRHVYHS